MEFKDIILPIVYALIFGFIFYRFHPLPKSKDTNRLVLFGYIYKLIMGIVLWLIYSHLYTDRGNLDIFRFYDDARVMYRSLSENPIHFFKMLTGIGSHDNELNSYYMSMNNWYKQYNYFLYNDTRTLIRFNAFIMLFSFGSYHVHTVFMAAFSYVGLLYLIKTFWHSKTDFRWMLICFVVFVPSVALWSSGVLKEGIFIGAFGVFVYSFLQLYQNKISSKILIGFGLSLFALLIIKIYLIVCLLPGLIYLIWNLFVFKQRPILSYLLIQLLLFSFILLLPVIAPQYDLFYMLYKKRIDFINEALIWEAGSLVKVPEMHSDPLSFIAQVPFALMMVFFRPFLWESDSLQMIVVSLENILIFGLMLLPIFAYKKPTKKMVSIILFLFSFVLYLFLLTGTITPILGSLVRYKMPGIPILLIIVFLLTDFKVLFNKLGLNRIQHE